MTVQTKAKKSGKKQGFAAMKPEDQKALASKGGKAAHALGRAHKWTSEEAKAAGRKGGLARKGKPNKKNLKSAGA